MKKGIVFILASLLTATACISCGGETGNSTLSSDTSSSSTQNGDAAQSAVVSILTTNDTTYGDSEGIKTLEKETGVDLEFVYVGADTAKEKFNIMVQSDSLPDVILSTPAFVTTSEIYRLGKEGVFMPLNDLVDQYGNNLKKVYEEHPDYREATIAPDGNMYALPAYYYGLGQEVRSHLYIEKNFLENLNMDIPKSIDELYEFLKAVKEQDANGNGDPNDEIPIINWESDTTSSIRSSAIMSAFTKISVDEGRVIEDGQVVFAPITDDYREGLKFIAKLYAEGLFYSESFSIDRNTLWTIAETDPDVNVIAMSSGHHGNCLCNWDSRRWEDYEAIGALIGPDGEKGNLPQNPNMQLQLKMAFSSTCRNPEAAMKVCDYTASEEGMKLAFWGVEGYDWEQPSAGAVDVNGDPALYRPFSVEERPEGYVSGQLGHGWCTFQTPETFASEVGPGRELGQGDKFNSQYYEKLYGDDLLPADEFWPSIIYFDGEALDELALLETDIDNTVKLAETEFIMGVRDINSDEVWNDYLNELKNNGLDRYLQISQEQYDLNMNK
jgi:putative aldouronate transport system substrate-binding protein